ncbi:MAG: bile acid:sodium symporter, partial [Planctomycetota bacterium]
MSAADQRSLFVRYWFLIALGATFVCGWMLFDWLPPGVVASIHDASGVRTATVTTVMLMLCVSMPTRRAMDALRHPAAGVVGTCLNLMVPMLAIAIWPLHLVAPQWLPREALQGIYVACLVPSTLASGSVWTHRAGGDDSISMWVTLATNGLCCVVVPFWLWVGVASGLLGSPVQDPLTVTDSVSIAGATDAAVTGVSWTTQFWKLACMVLLPLVLGQCLRRIGLAGIADRFKRQISFLAQIGIDREH